MPGIGLTVNNTDMINQAFHIMDGRVSSEKLTREKSLHLKAKLEDTGLVKGDKCIKI